MIQRPSMMREFGTAFAVLAIYLLTVLGPLHQARASQLDFAELGYSTPQSGWVLCMPAGDTGEDRDISVAKCPAAGIGKADAIEPDMAGLAFAAPLGRIANKLPWAEIAAAAPPLGAPGGPRAPPVGV